MTAQPRTVLGHISLSLDGRVTGRGGDYDMGWVAPHAMTDTYRGRLLALTQHVTTAVLGRKNYLGFLSYWPAAARDDDTDARERRFATWLDSVDKVVISHSLQEATWTNSRIARDPVTAIKELRFQPGGDIAVMSSSSIIRELLAANELDRLILTICPEVAGGGAPLFAEGTPQSSWTLTDSAITESGAACLVYDRAH